MGIEKTTHERPPIERAACYTASQFLVRTGMGRSGLRAAERRGLRTVKIGNRKYIRGEDWFQYLSKQK